MKMKILAPAIALALSTAEELRRGMVRTQFLKERANPEQPARPITCKHSEARRQRGIAKRRKGRR